MSARILHIVFALLPLVFPARAAADDLFNDFFLRNAASLTPGGGSGSAAVRAMGSAATGKAPDISSAVFNPAAAASLGGFHISVTPLVSIHSASAVIGEGGGESKNGFSRLLLGNVAIGATHDFDKGGVVRRISFSFTADRSNLSERRIACEWTNGGSSLAGSLAGISNAGGYSHEELQDFGSPAPVPCVLGYRTETFSRIGSESSYSYLGITENYDVVTGGGVPEAVQQRYIFNRTGIKGNYELGISVQLGGILYFGAALGISTISSDIKTSLLEYSTDPTLFDTRFNSLNYLFSCSNSASGIYGNFGLLLTPWKGLGIGISLLTPCNLSFDGKFNSGMECDWFSDDSYSVLTGKKPARSETSTRRFRLHTPIRLSAGVSWDFDGKALLSADCTWSDLASCSVSSDRFEDNGAAQQMNAAICGTLADNSSPWGCSLRVNAGGQVALWKTLCLRCGYSYDFPGYGQGRDIRHYICSGLGYSFTLGRFSLGADLSWRHIVLPEENTGQLYPDYPNAASKAPSVCGRTRCDEISLTLGLNF